MKYIFMIFSLVFSVNSFAVQTKYCPQAFVVKVPEVTVFSKNFVQQKINEFRFDESHNNTYDSDSVQFFQDGTSVEAFQIQFTLDTVRNSNCYYHNESLWNGSVRAAITGTDKSPKLTLTFTDENAEFDRRTAPVELLMFADTHVKRPFYDFSGEELQIKSLGVKNSRDESYSVYIPLGKAVIAGESQKNYDLGNERWSIDLLTETCGDKLNEEISTVLNTLENDNLVTVLPKTIGYQYFKVEFKELKGGIVSAEPVAVFEFGYSTVDDQHLVCDKITPEDFIY